MKEDLAIQRRGLYKSPLGIPKTGHELLTCYYPLRLDTYSGCVHDCKYCYAKELLEPRGYWNPNIRPADINIIRNLFSKEQKDTTINSAIYKKIPVRMGGLTDCFQEIERKFRISYDTLKILHENHYPYLIVTKSPLLAEKEYLDVLDKDLASIQYTIVSLDENIIRRLEPGAPTIESRLQAIEILSKRGFYVTGRISPIFPPKSNEEIEDLKKVIHVLKKHGVQHILIEFFRGNDRMLDRVSSVYGELRPYMYRKGHYWRVKREIKDEIYHILARESRNLDLTFGICSDGDPIPCEIDGIENKCCGIVKGWPANCVACELYKRSKERGEVSLSDFETDFSFDKKLFAEAWEKGLFERFIYDLKMVNGKYTIKEEKND